MTRLERIKKTGQNNCIYYGNISSQSWYKLNYEYQDGYNGVPVENHVIFPVPEYMGEIVSTTKLMPYIRKSLKPKYYDRRKD